MGVTGFAEKSHDVSLIGGFRYGEQLSDEAKDALREVGLAALHARGRLPAKFEELLTADGVGRLVGALAPSVDQIFEAMQAQAEEEQEAR
jgi:hypothetical protein